MAAAERVSSLVSGNPVAVFSKTYCPYCSKVKSLLASLKAKLSVVELDLDEEGSEIQASLAKQTGLRTVPQIFIGGKFIGGCDDTLALHSRGKLVPMLKEAGALA